MNNSHLKRLPLVIALAALIAAGCSRAVADPPPPASPPTSAFNVEAAVSLSTNPLVQLEARWMCDVQRFAFADLEAMSTELTSRLDGAGLDMTEYETFKASLENSPDLRGEVLAEYVAICSAPG